MNSVFLFFLIAFTAFVVASPTTPPPPKCLVAQCNPNPLLNKCDITTSCIYTKPNSQLHCACRDGYKSKYANTDITKHYRTLFAGQESRVFVAPGVVCDTLCDQWYLGPGACKEVSIVAACS